MKRRINVAILFGGKSAEHEVSLQSAKNIVHAIDKEKYNPIPIKVSRSGKWALSLTDPKNIKRIDVVFPVLHGPFGEDGTVQGLLKLIDIPFVGAGVLGSAVGMDKDVTKRLLRDAGIPIANFLVFKDVDSIKFEDVVSELGLPFFIKPANLGSSVGVSKVKNKSSFKSALSKAFKHDRKIVIEEFVEGREIECAVLGNDNPVASVPGEVIVNDEFYSYEAKYIDKKGARLEIPARLDENTKRAVQKLAVKTFKTLLCEGLGRVDFFIRKNGEVLVNEINTMPGFTSRSMYPKLWEASGVSYTELIDRLINLAFERFEGEKSKGSDFHKTLLRISEPE